MLVAGALLLGFVATIPLTGSAAPPPYVKGTITCPSDASPGDLITVTGAGLPELSPVTFAFTTAGVGTVIPTITAATGTFSTTGVILLTTPTGTQTLESTIIASDGTVANKSCAIAIR